MVPLPVTTAVLVPLELPPSVRPPEPKPVTDSLKVTVKWIGEALVGSAWVAALTMVAEGCVVSLTKVTEPQPPQLPTASSLCT